jgi:hypothetical protein
MCLGESKEVKVAYRISLTAHEGERIEPEVHASATGALVRFREARSSGIEMTIMGPKGERLSENDLAYLAEGEVEAKR